MRNKLSLLIQKQIALLPRLRTETEAIILHTNPIFGSRLYFREVEEKPFLHQYDIQQTLPQNYNPIFSNKPPYLRRKMMYR